MLRKIPFLVLLMMPTLAVSADIQNLQGECTKESHVADGSIHDDLSKKRSRFYCDSAVITFFDDHNSHIMIQFTSSKSKHAPILGFAGEMEDGVILDVANIYLEPGNAIPATKGNCKFFLKGRHMDAIMCGGRIEEGDRATAPIVVFQAAPEQ